MKTCVAIVFGLALTTSHVVAQNPDRDVENKRPYFSTAASYNATVIEKAKRIYLHNLGSENDGVLESTIAHVAHLRAVSPLENMQEIETRLGQLAATGRTPSIRYKAHLAGLLFADPQMFSNETETTYTTGDEFFVALASRLQGTLLGYNKN